MQPYHDNRYGYTNPNTGKITPLALQTALRYPWLAQALSHLILKYESEWDGNMARWEALTPWMRTAKENWQCELQRIKALQWWDEVKGKVEGFPDCSTVYHIHPIALVGNFAVMTLSVEETRVRALLRVIRVGEGTSTKHGYSTLYGGSTFENFADHPRKKISAGKYTSTAAGAYQILEATWDGLVKSKGYQNFTPENQDRARLSC